MNPAFRTRHQSEAYSEFITQRFNAGMPPDLFFWRDSAGNEVHLVYEAPGGLQGVEIKSGVAFASDWLTGIKKWRALPGNQACKPWVVHGGKQTHGRDEAVLIGWRDGVGHSG